MTSTILTVLSVVIGLAVLFAVLLFAVCAIAVAGYDERDHE